MTVRTRAQLNADANSALPDNVAGEISPADVRQRIKDLADSARLAEDLGDAAGKNVGSGANDVAAGNHGHGAATSGAPGFMAAADKQKLDGIEAGADVTDAQNVGSAIHGASAKTGPVDADTVAIIDSAASNALKKVTWANVKAALKTYFDTLYATATHVHAVATTSVAGFMSSIDKSKLDGIAAGATANDTDANLKNRANHTGSQAISTITGLQSALDAKQSASAKGQANGYASLDGTGKVPMGQIPDALIGSVKYEGTWNASTNTPTIPAAAPANKGAYYIVSVAGTTTVSGINDWEIGDWIISDGSVWGKVDNTDQVMSVNGQRGGVVLTKADVGLGNVDNTSDANKPISTATQNALDTKAGTAVATTSANGLMSSADKTKLDGVEAGAQVNTVTSVAGKTGAVPLAKSDVGLGNVDNTSDAAKPVSTAQQTALNGKANLSGGNSFSGTQRGNITALSVSSGSIAWNLANGNDFTVTLTANATLSLPTGIATHVGQKGRILVSQDGTGGRTLAVVANFIPLGSSSVPAIPSAANAKAYLAYDVISTTEIAFTLTGVGA